METATHKKKKGTCKHEVIVSKHYNKSLWSKYADHVMTKKQTIEIDQNYAAKLIFMVSFRFCMNDKK